MSTAGKIIRNTVYMFSGTFAVMVLSIVFTVLCARYFGAEGYGLYAFSLSLVMMVTAFSKSGLDIIAVREVAKDRSLAAKYLSNITAFKILFSLAVLALVSLYLFSSGRPLHREMVVLVFVSSSLFYVVSEGFRWGFQAFQLMEYESALKVLQSSLVLLALLIVVVFRSDISTFACLYLAGSVMLTIICFFLASYKIARFGLELDLGFLKELVYSAIPVGLMFAFTAIYLNVDNVLISSIRGDIETGFYSAAYKIMAYVKNLIMFYLLVIFPALSHFGRETLSGAFAKLLGKSVELLLIVTLPIAFGVFFLSGQFIELFFGAGFAPSAQALTLLIWILPIAVLTSLMGHALISVGRQLICGLVTFIGLIVNLVVDLMLIPVYGFMGAAYGILAAEVVVLVVITAFAVKHLTFDLRLFNAARIFACASLMGLVTYLLRGHGLPVSVGASAAVFGVLLFASGAVTRQDLDMIRGAFSSGDIPVESVEYE